MSQKLELDFIEKRPFSIQYLPILSILLLVLGLFSMMYLYQQYQSLSANYQAAKLALNAVKPTPVETTKIKPEPALPATVVKQVNETINFLNSPWETLYAGLEQLDMRDVALLSIEPNIKKQQLVLTGQAKNMATLLSYVERVDTLPMLSQVYLQKHNVEKDVPFTPVSFTIVAHWL